MRNLVSLVNSYENIEDDLFVLINNLLYSDQGLSLKFSFVNYPKNVYLNDFLDFFFLSNLEFALSYYFKLRKIPLIKNFEYSFEIFRNNDLIDSFTEAVHEDVFFHTKKKYDVLENDTFEVKVKCANFNPQSPIVQKITNFLDNDALAKDICHFARKTLSTLYFPLSEIRCQMFHVDDIEEAQETNFSLHEVVRLRYLLKNFNNPSFSNRILIQGDDVLNSYIGYLNKQYKCLADNKYLLFQLGEYV